jgi:hypothetical protein
MDYGLQYMDYGLQYMDEDPLDKKNPRRGGAGVLPVVIRPAAYRSAKSLEGISKPEIGHC